MAGTGEVTLFERVIKTKIAKSRIANATFNAKSFLLGNMRNLKP